MKNNQTTNKVFMVRPNAFRMNEETAVNNHYQEKNTVIENANTLACQEFDTLVEILTKEGIEVIVIDDNDTETPDAVFPNNWISFHGDGKVALYPMYAPNRRKERKESTIDSLEQNGVLFNEFTDYTTAESENIFLEGTGSMVLDRENKKCYAAISERTNEDLAIEFCEDFEYTPVLFHSYQSVDGKRELIYHTNVMMCVGSQLALVCLDSIDDKKEKKQLIDSLREDGKEIINLSEDQINQFAGNMIELKNKEGKSFLVMSSSAYNSLENEQKNTISQHIDKVIHSPIPTIETLGGGSVRCMIAEIF